MGKLSREWRHARKRNEPAEILKHGENRYLHQKKYHCNYDRRQKSAWESRKIDETWKDSKKFWKMIKELLGKSKEVEEETYVYDDEGEKQEIMTCEESFAQKWTANIYQKLKKADFTFWYGDEHQKGVKTQMEERLELGDSEIMENPIINEKEFVNTIKNIRTVE